jgi:hypothetical protein
VENRRPEVLEIMRRCIHSEIGPVGSRQYPAYHCELSSGPCTPEDCQRFEQFPERFHT